MIPNWPSTTQRTRTLLQTLLAAATAAIIIAVAACSEQQPQPTARPQTTDERPMQTIDAMAQEIAALQTKAAVPAETDEPDEPENTAQLEPSEAPETPETATPPTSTPMVIPTPSGPGICGRSPEIQLAIINTLEISLCQAITAPELFRITQLSVAMETAKAGDFNDLVNLKKLYIITKTIEGGAFHQLAEVTELNIDVEQEGSLATGALQGMTKLTELRIVAEQGLTLATESISGLPALEKLEVDAVSPAKIAAGAIQNMTSLKSLQLQWRSAKEETPYRNILGKMVEPLPAVEVLGLQFTSEYSNQPGLPTLDPAMFTNFPKLLNLSIQGENTDRIRLNEDSFANNPELKGVQISGQLPKIRNAFRSLHKLEGLKIYSIDSEGNRKEQEIALSPYSPLMSDILNGEQSPRGYKVIPPGAD